eukprot:scaffold51709_cov85-Cyclotella_meneghiniana.AAC.1
MIDFWLLWYRLAIVPMSHWQRNVQYKPFTLTNQPETGAIHPLASSRVVGCWGVVEKAVFDVKQPAEMHESEIFVFGRVGGGGAKSAEVEAAMTPLGELVLASGVDVSSAARGRLKSRQLL